MTWVLRRIIAVGLVLLAAACRASLPDLTYRCSRERRYPADGGATELGYPYVEGFDDDEGDEALPTLRDRCWQTQDVAHTDVLPSDSDLIIRPNFRAVWSARTRAPSVTQHLDGDFVIAALPEIVNIGGEGADSCNLRETEVAGLVAHRDEQPAGWLTFTVRPFGVTETNCLDDAPVPPTAIVERRSHGLGITADAAAEKEDVGADGEANIALCRQGDTLSSFYWDAARVPAPAWQEVGTSVRIGPGSLDVGLTAASDGELFVEGHFNWVVLQHVGTLPSDGCKGALESFKEPKDEDP